MNKSLEFVNNRLSERGKATLKKENVSVNLLTNCTPKRRITGENAEA